MIRHGLPVRRETTDGSPADPELDTAGQEQAQRLARWLAPEGIDAVYVSPMRRALETAAPLAAAGSGNGPPSLTGTACVASLPAVTS